MQITANRLRQIIREELALAGAPEPAPETPWKDWPSQGGKVYAHHITLKLGAPEDKKEPGSEKDLSPHLGKMVSVTPEGYAFDDGVLAVKVPGRLIPEGDENPVYCMNAPDKAHVTIVTAAGIKPSASGKMIKGSPLKTDIKLPQLTGRIESVKNDSSEYTAIVLDPASHDAILQAFGL
jgi:hypothetical protein